MSHNLALKYYDMTLAAFGDKIVRKAPVAYLKELRGRYYAPKMTLLCPHTTDEVAKIVTFCAENNIPIVPFGGGTGLVGGQIKEDGDAIILSVERMTKIRKIYKNENVMIVEAGAILANVQKAADDADLLFPLSLASEGSCCIGGNLATNAGGVQVLRYGNMRDLCLGIEAVLPDGSVYHGLHRLRKDNTGYDIRNLLIGSEGSLGIITAAVLKLFPKPKECTTAFVSVASPQDAITLLISAQENLGGLVSAFELIGKQGFLFLQEAMPQVRLPFKTIPQWGILLEAVGGKNAGLDDRILTVFEKAMKLGLVKDVILAQSESQRNEFWNVREMIPEANRAIGAISSHDISIPISLIPRFIAETPNILTKICDMRINCFGHLGDGNLHYNCYPPKGKSKVDFLHFQNDIKFALHEQVHRFGGSFSAEHGVGRLKTYDLERYGDPAKLSVMRAIKKSMDPKGIMNPGAVLR